MKKRFLRRKVLPVIISAAMIVSIGVPAAAADSDTGTDSSTSSLTDAEDIALSFEENGYVWEAVDTDEDGEADYYQIEGMAIETVVTNEEYQYLNIYAPAAYFNEDGSINYESDVNGYTASTAPIIYQNNCSGWNSSTPASYSNGSDYIEEGFIYVGAGARSRNAYETDEDGSFTTHNGKSPTQVVDLKAGIRVLRLNADYIPGDTDRIVSVGTSGGGQMSSILGATGNMDEYYSYLYEAGAAGIDYVDGEYVSTIDDDIFADMAYCPIADIENADLAYAWWRYDAGETSGGGSTFTEFKLALQDDLAVAYCEYINASNITDEDGNQLTFDVDENGDIISPRQGSYYDKILENMSDALNLFVENTDWDSSDYADMDAYIAGEYDVTVNDAGDAWTTTFTCGDTETTSTWLVKNEDGTYSVTDMAGFINGTGLSRNKDIPGFDTFGETAENNAFGTSDEYSVHYSASVAAVLEENYDYYATLDGFDEVDVDDYILDASRSDVQEQTYLMNATQIMRNVADGTEESDIAQYWRTRNGTADQHTSFTIAYNLCMAASAAGAETDYSLVWDMTHGSREGDTTGTFIDWVNEIVAEANAEAGDDAEDYTDEIEYTTIDATTYLDYSNGIDEGVYEWVLSEDGTYYYLAQTADNSQYVYTSANLTDDGAYQQMMICVPVGYMTTDADGNVIVDETASVNGYTAETAPIVFYNQCYGWNSSSPQFGYEGDENPIDYGYILVGAGARSRNLDSGKAPTPVVDLKAGVIELKANDDVIPGDKERIISQGMSGGGQMSSILGASGNMEAYYSYMYEAGVLGVTYDEDTDTYSSVYDDSVYAAQTYSAIADIENADLAYAWMWYDTADAGGASVTSMGSSEAAELTEFQLALQQDEAEAYVEYLNGLGLTDEEGNALTIDPVTEEDGTVNLHNGSYYDAVLQNLSDSLNAQVASGGDIVDRNGDTISDEDIASFATIDENGTYTVTDLKAYLVATGTVNARNKDVPGFDTFDLSAENNAFGSGGTDDGVHYSQSVAQVLKDNLDSYLDLDGYAEEAENVAAYIALLDDTEENANIVTQTNLMNATEILLGNDGYTAVTPAKYWRVRSGAVDEHTSYTISFNLALAAASNENVTSVDYGQMWGVGHSSSEGTSLGTFVEWVAEIAPAATQEEESTETPAVKTSNKKTVNGVTYQILSKKKGTAKVIKIAKSKKKVTIKNTVKIGGKKYKVTTIAKNAAKGNKKLKKVTIGKNVTKIAANAFKGDKKLKNVIIKSKKLKTVGKNAFKNTAKKITIKSPKAKKKKYKKLISKKKTGISKKAVYK